MVNKQVKKIKELCKEESVTPPKIKEEKEPEGLCQTFKDSIGRIIALSSILDEKDYWQTSGRMKKTIIIHDAVKKIADLAGVSKSVEYTILTQPDCNNNYQLTMQAKVWKEENPKDCAVELGETNRSNLGNKGRGNPANMAQKRAYDRAVFRLLGITSLLSEEELTDKDKEEEHMDNLSHEERKEIAPIINQLLLAKSNKDLIVFSKEMKTKAEKLLPQQLDYIRKLYSKRVAEFVEKKF